MIGQPDAGPAAGAARVSFRWLIDARNDLLWYIGSTAAGWAYAGLVLLAVALLARPLEDAFGVIRVGGLAIPLTLRLLVFSSWALLLDAPHVWGTLARTFLDPDECRVRRRELWLSWAWFLVGPAVVLLPYLIAAALRPMGVEVPAAVLPMGAVAFTVFFRIWAYYHVVRQHWGFVALYRRKNGESDPLSHRADVWFFNVALYAPLVMFITGSIYPRTPGMPPLGLDRVPGIGVVYLAAWGAFLAAVVGYAGFQVWLWRRRRPLNGPKLLLMLAVLPLHLVALNHPWLAAMLVPIVTVGHNLQYHRIVWGYGRTKYQSPERRVGFRLARLVFSRVWLYFGVGLLFTLALYRGPWVEWLQATLGMELNRSVLNGVGMMAGLSDPAQMSLGQQLFGTFLLGWAMQHYYLDAKIWRVSRDKAVARELAVE